MVTITAWQHSYSHDTPWPPSPGRPTSLPVSAIRRGVLRQLIRAPLPGRRPLQSATETRPAPARRHCEMSADNGRPAARAVHPITKTSIAAPVRLASPDCGAGSPGACHHEGRNYMNPRCRKQTLPRAIGGHADHTGGSAPADLGRDLAGRQRPLAGAETWASGRQAFSALHRACSACRQEATC